jgi:hypothetical protein
MSHDSYKPGPAMCILLALTGCLGMAGGFAREAGQQETETGPSGFNYSDDWSIVSAPPPPGPYYSVNVDPRVPGQEDNMPPSASDFEPTSGLQEQLIESFISAPPAAGRPASQPASSGRPSAHYAPHGYSSHPYGMSYGYPQGGSAALRNYSRDPGPAGGYYPPAGSSPWAAPPSGSEPEVPPPPVYDRMIKTTPPGPYRY